LICQSREEIHGHQTRATQRPAAHFAVGVREEGNLYTDSIVVLDATPVAMALPTGGLFPDKVEAKPPSFRPTRVDTLAPPSESRAEFWLFRTGELYL
jgi:hypothetical protein